MPRLRDRPGDVFIILTMMVLSGSCCLFRPTFEPDRIGVDVSTMQGIVEGFHAGESRDGHRVNTYHVRTEEGLAFVTDSRLHQIGAPLTIESVTRRNGFVSWRAAR